MPRDLGNSTLCPGFIDAHTHLALDFSSGYNQALIDKFRMQIPEQAYRAAANAAKTLEAGFTTVRDMGSAFFIDVSLRINLGHADYGLCQSSGRLYAVAAFLWTYPVSVDGVGLW
jgi:imidazolonepropionase-like amidohydrolase